MRAYSAGGVVFRLAPMHSSEKQLSMHQYDQEHDVFGARNLISSVSSVPGISSVPNTATMEVALVGRSHFGLWVLPKGTPQPGETIEQVAVREVQEETGLLVQLIGYIGSVSYSFIRDHIRYHKQVRHFLLQAIGGDTALHDHEYDCVEWFPIHEACRRLKYQNEAHILYQAEDLLQHWLQNQLEEGRK